MLNNNEKSYKYAAKLDFSVWEIGLNYKGSLFSLNMMVVGDLRGTACS